MQLMTVESIEFWVKIYSLDKEHFLWGLEGAGDASFGLLIIARVLNFGLFPASCWLGRVVMELSDQPYSWGCGRHSFIWESR